MDEKILRIESFKGTINALKDAPNHFLSLMNNSVGITNSGKSACINLSTCCSTFKEDSVEGKELYKTVNRIVDVYQSQTMISIMATLESTMKQNVIVPLSQLQGMLKQLEDALKEINNMKTSPNLKQKEQDFDKLYKTLSKQRTEIVAKATTNFLNIQATAFSTLSNLLTSTATTATNSIQAAAAAAAAASVSAATTTTSTKSVSTSTHSTSSTHSSPINGTPSTTPPTTTKAIPPTTTTTTTTNVPSKTTEVSIDDFFSSTTTKKPTPAAATTTTTTASDDFFGLNTPPTRSTNSTSPVQQQQQQNNDLDDFLRGTPSNTTTTASSSSSSSTTTTTTSSTKPTSNSSLFDLLAQPTANTKPTTTASNHLDDFFGFTSKSTTTTATTTTAAAQKPSTSTSAANLMEDFSFTSKSTPSSSPVQNRKSATAASTSSNSTKPSSSSSSGSTDGLSREQLVARREAMERDMINEKKQEYLDRDAAEIKRKEEAVQLESVLRERIEEWAKNKKNIRALLASMHEVLWPDCKWKEMKLSELVVPDQVKKAYRKAIIIIHPDRLTDLPLEHQILGKNVFDQIRTHYQIFEQKEL